MSVLTLPVVEPDRADVDDDSAHIVCCDPDRALCGEDVSRKDFIDGPVDEERDCEPCVNRSRLGVACGAPLCRLRQRWRDWRSS